MNNLCLIWSLDWLKKSPLHQKKLKDQQSLSVIKSQLHFFTSTEAIVAVKLSISETEIYPW